MNKENCALKLVDEIILYYDARSKKHQSRIKCRVSDCRSPDPTDFSSPTIKINHSGRTMALGSTQALREMSIRCIS